jgi:LSD1 subclass zinc finger protein
MRLPESRHRRQGVQNVAHGAEADHQQAKIGMRLQTLIFSQGRMRRTGRKPVVKIGIAKKLTSGAKAQRLFCAICGTTNVVPFQNQTFITGR